MDSERSWTVEAHGKAVVLAIKLLKSCRPHWTPDDTGETAEAWALILDDVSPLDILSATKVLLRDGVDFIDPGKIRNKALGREPDGSRIIDGYHCPPGLRPRTDIWGRIILRADGNCLYEADSEYHRDAERQPFTPEIARKIVDRVELGRGEARDG